MEVINNAFWNRRTQTVKPANFFTEELLTDDKSFPNLASVPNRPKYSTDETERVAIQQKLAADHASAQHIKKNTKISMHDANCTN
ncbi:hypothetical protein [Candidatus Endolissoclinum faulkneri]|nr:hypothetical protein [Candidatus Endolissoclinum faulkneri]